MTSRASDAVTEAYVWVWLPGAHDPVVAGLLSRRGDRIVFNYGQSYLKREDALSLFAPELPLQRGLLPLLPGLSLPGCIRDASPDAWGRRVLLYRKWGNRAGADVELDELSILLESGSDRIGALDFQRSATRYLAREAQESSLEALMQAADQVDQGMSLSRDLDLALLHGTSLGGARPKVLLRDEGDCWIAKFSSSTDLYSLVKAEYLAMRMASKIGLNVAEVKLLQVLGKDVLLVRRFDRRVKEGRFQRRMMVSALTLLALDEMMAAYASYQDLAGIIRHRFVHPKATLKELFSRMVFNILCGNTDDHARNHAAFWDGHRLELTPAYDLCPQSRTGQEASQAMRIRGSDRRSQIKTLIAAAPDFLLKAEEAIRIVNHQVAVITDQWDALCDEALLTDTERRGLWRRQFLNPYAFYEAPEGVRVPES